MMPLLMLATVKDRPGAVLGVVESVVALLVPRALVERSCSLESFTLRSDWRRAGAGRAGGGRRWSSARRWAESTFLAAARTSRCAGSGGSRPHAGVAFRPSAGCDKAILPWRGIRLQELDHQRSALSARRERARWAGLGHG